MMWSSALTSKNALIAAGLCLGLLGGGCAGHKPVLPPLRGSVNLNQLVRRHPGWGGIGQYDAALRRLEQAARSLPPSGQTDQKVATLPGLPEEALRSVQAAPDVNVAGTNRRLDATQQVLLSGLRARREIARADQIQQQRSVWRDEARQRYPVPTQTANVQPDLELQLLQANVQTLTRTVNNWKQSTPPTPELDQLKARVAAESAKLDTLLAAQAHGRETAAAQFRADVQRSHEARVAYVQAQADTLEAQLRMDDSQLAAAETVRLSQERDAVMKELASPAGLLVPPVGFVGAETLPRGLGQAQATLSQASLAASETRLRAQRTRWIKFLVDDTQAAALDVAGQQRWDITFGPPRPGDRDLTSALTQALASSVWRL